MFDMGKIGVTVSQLRKSQNMTQLELADKLNVSFQAVSNWERGNSMPDISKLPELAQIFGVSIDELLGKESGLIRSAAEGTLQEYLERETPGMDELVDAAPILKPSQMDATLRGLPEEKLDLRQIEDLLPFLGEDLLEELAWNAVSTGKMQDLDYVVPFLKQNAVDQIFAKCYAEGKDVAGIIPFVSRNILAEVAQTLYRERGLTALDDYAPVLSKEQLWEIAQVEYEKHGLRYFESIAPFLKREDLNALARKALTRDGIKAISPIAPFLDRQLLSEFVKERYL